MDVLLLITVVCFLGLFVTAIAVARHVRIVETRLPERERNPPRPSKYSSGATGGTIGNFSGPMLATRQDSQSVALHKEPDWRFLVSQERRVARGSTLSPLLRKPPASARDDRRERPDWAYFNEDLGDLADPYEPPTPKTAWTGGSRRR